MSKFKTILMTLFFIIAVTESYSQSSDPIWINAEIGSLIPIDGFLSHDETKLYVLSKERIHVVDAKTGLEINNENDSNFVRRLGDSASFDFFTQGDDDRLFAVEQSRGRSRFIELDLKTNVIVYEEIFRTHTYRFRDLEYSTKSKRVYLLLDRIIFDMNTLDYTDRGSTAFPECKEIELSADGKYIAAYHNKVYTEPVGKIGYRKYLLHYFYCYDIKTFERYLYRSWKVYLEAIDPYSHFSFTPDSKNLAAVIDDQFYLWDVPNFSLVAHQKPIDFCDKCKRLSLFKFTHSKDLTAMLNMSVYPLNDSEMWMDMFVQTNNLTRPAEHVINSTPNVSFYEITKDDKYYFGASDGVLYMREIDWKPVGMPLEDDTPIEKTQTAYASGQTSLSSGMPQQETVNINEDNPTSRLAKKIVGEYPGTMWKFELKVPSMELGNVKSNILSSDESKLYVLTQRELYIYEAENGDLKRMYIDELNYPADSSEATFTTAALSADGEKLYVVGSARITKDGIEKLHPRFFVFNLNTEEIVYDELFDFDTYYFGDIQYSPTRERLFLSSYKTIISINTNDFTDRISATYSNYIDKLYVSPDGNSLMSTTYIYNNSTLILLSFIMTISYDPITLELFSRGPDVDTGRLQYYKSGSFTPDSKYFCVPSLSTMYLWDLSNFKSFSYYVQDDLKEFRNFYKIDFSKKHHYKGIASMHGDVNRTVMISLSETEDISGIIIKNTGSDFVQMTEAEDFYYEISQDTLSKHILDWGYTTNVSLPEEIRASEVYPNPVDDLLIIDFELNQTNATVVELVNAAGISVRRIDAGLLGAGEHHIGVNVADLPAGVYFTRVRSGRSLITNKFMKAE